MHFLANSVIWNLFAWCHASKLLNGYVVIKRIDGKIFICIYLEVILI